ncbi:hypothetical protein CCY99_08200 [Helicobacter sp. 16-1353]|nr:hypothetical protein CCY99_08200 [Helicobacter sp. 16-1353]
MLSLHGEYFDNKTTLRIYWELFRGYGYAKWGITIDGYDENKKDYIKSHIKNKAPAICLIRCPIETIISGINYGIGRSIIENRFNSTFDYMGLLNDERFLKDTIYFTSNINQIKHHIDKIIYIDTTMLMKNNAYQTIKKIAKELNINPPNNEKLLINVNDTFTKCFPYKINIDNNEILISPFEGEFSLIDYDKTHYNMKDTRFYIQRDYIPSRFPDRILHISSDKEIIVSNELLNKIHKNIELYLDKVESMQKYYDKYKINKNILFEYLVKNPKVLEKLKIILAKETSMIKNDALHIFNSWIYYQEFLEL